MAPGRTFTSSRALKGPDSPPTRQPRSPPARQLRARRVPPRSFARSLARSLTWPGGGQGGPGRGARPGAGLRRPAGRLCHRWSPPSRPSAARSAGRVQLCSISGPGKSPAPWNRPSSPTRSGRRPRQTGARWLTGQPSAPGACDLGSWGPGPARSDRGPSQRGPEEPRPRFPWRAALGCLHYSVRWGIPQRGKWGWSGLPRGALR